VVRISSGRRLAFIEMGEAHEPSDARDLDKLECER
jgi:hypothetical protein